MRIKDNFYKIIDIYSKEYKTQKFNPADITLYRESYSGLKEWFEFYPDDVSKLPLSPLLNSDIILFLKSYHNSTGYKCDVTRVGKDGIIFTDNLGNSYMQNEYSYCGNMDETKNALRYRFDENNNLVYYMAPDGAEHRYSYNDEGLITEYICESGNIKKRIEYYYDYHQLETCERETIFEDGILKFEVERKYDSQKRQISYHEMYIKDNSDNCISAYTDYDDKNNISETIVFKGTQMIDQYITKSDDTSYGLGYKK